MENTNSDACVFIETPYKTVYMHSCVDIHLLKIECSLKPAMESHNRTEILQQVKHQLPNYLRALLNKRLQVIVR